MLRGDKGIDEEERKMIEDGACNLPLRMERGQIENSTETFSDGEMGGAMQKSAGSIMHRAEVPEESLKGLG